MTTKRACFNCEGTLYPGAWGWYCFDCQTYQPDEKTDQLATRAMEENDISAYKTVDYRAAETKRTALKHFLDEPDPPWPDHLPDPPTVEDLIRDRIVFTDGSELRLIVVGPEDRETCEALEWYRQHLRAIMANADPKAPAE